MISPCASPGTRKRSAALGGIVALVVGMAALLSSGCGGKKEGEGKTARPAGGLEKVYERGPLKVVVYLDNPEPTIADRLTLELEMTSSEDYEVTAPAFGEKLDQFGIVDFSATQPELVGEGKVRESRTYVLEPFLSGDYVIPPMTFRFRKADGSDEEHELVTEEIKLIVTSLLPEDAAAKLEIHEVAPPVELTKPASPWFWPLVGGGAAVGIAGLLMLIWPRRKSGPAAVPRRAAHEIAFDALEALVAEDLPGQGEIKAFYQRISDILRHYIENRFGLHAPERTTEEFLAELDAGKTLEAAHQPLLARFLRYCDLVKFAEHQPSHDDIQETFDSCKNFVLETRETEPAATAA